MRKIFLILISAILACTACNRNGQDHTLSKSEQAARTYIDSALQHIDRHDLQAAMLQLKKAEQLIPRLDSAKTIYRIYQYIGWINESSGANELALQYQNRALEYAMAHGKPEDIVEVLINKANTFFNLNLPDSARNVSKTAMLFYNQVSRGQQSVIQKHLAHYELLRDSLKQAEQHAYRAFMLAQDSSALGNALTLLSQIYTREKKAEKARLVMSIMSKKNNSTLEYNRLLTETHLQETHGNYRKAYESLLLLKALDDSLQAEKKHVGIVRVQNEYDKAMLQLDRARQRYRYSAVIIALLVVLFGLSYWYFHRNQRLYRRFQEQIANVKEEMNAQLSAKNLTIEEMKQTANNKLDELNLLKRKLPLAMQTDRNYESVAQTKLGIDVLDAILRNANISQFGKKEQVAVARIMPNVDAPLARILNDTELSLTPKETFFCIMERNGKSDKEKAEAFCCSEQAVRSTKSRLTKKMKQSTAALTQGLFPSPAI